MVEAHEFQQFGEIVELPLRDPQLCVIVDTEEEFDWRTFSPQARSVRNVGLQEPLQRLYERYGIVPTYAVDYPVASQEDGYRPLREFLSDKRCEIGAHLHPWVNPPIDEVIGELNSYPCNLPSDLEYRKLKELTETIQKNLKVRPCLYKAGRYGFGENTTTVLKALGYLIDCSVLPGTDLRRQSGPNFTAFPNEPYWLSDGSLIELPVTTGFLGMLGKRGAGLYPWLRNRWAEQMRLPGVFARLRLIDRIRLTPEGISLDEAKRLTRYLIREQNFGVLTLTYHSSSLRVGCTSYVRDKAELASFIAWIDGYLEFFFGEVGGVATTPRSVYEQAVSFRNC